MLGTSRPTYVRAKSIVAAAEEDPEKFGDLVEKLDQGAKVTPIYDEMQKRRGVVKPEPKPKPEPARSEWHHKKRHIDSGRIVRETVLALDGLCAGLQYIDYSTLDVEERLTWLESLSVSMPTLNKFHRSLKNGADQ